MNVNNKFIHSKSFIISLIILLVITVSLTGTYAWFTWNSVENTNLTMKIGKFTDVMFSNGNEITSELSPVFNYSDGEKTSFMINNRSTTGGTITYKIKLNITTIPTELASSSVKYSLVINNELIVTGDFLNTSNGSSLEIFTGAQSGGISYCELYLYIDGNIENNSSMMNKNIIGNVSLEATEFTGTLTELITNLYNTPSKKVANNNNINYNYATSANLMNDRLGGVTSDYNAGNIRYYGANPNNYIDIGDRDSSGNIMLWRIIGLFKNVELENGTTDMLIKIIRDKKIDMELSWDTSPSTINDGKGINEWSQADIMKLLNPGYETETVGGSLYYNSSTGNCYYDYNDATKTCDFTSDGLSDDVKEKIESVAWNLGAHLTPYVYTNQIYDYERANNVITNTEDGISRTTKWFGEIALPYPSDYGYATNFNYCNVSLDKYGDVTSNCKDNDWLYTDSGQYFLTSTNFEPTGAWVQKKEGSVYSNKFIALDGYFKPAMYLKNSLKVVKGDGTQNNPYVIE